MQISVSARKKAKPINPSTKKVAELVDALRELKFAPKALKAFILQMSELKTTWHRGKLPVLEVTDIEGRDFGLHNNRTFALVSKKTIVYFDRGTAAIADITKAEHNLMVERSRVLTKAPGPAALAK